MAMSLYPAVLHLTKHVPKIGNKHLQAPSVVYLHMLHPIIWFLCKPFIPAPQAIIYHKNQQSGLKCSNSNLLGHLIQDIYRRFKASMSFILVFIRLTGQPTTGHAFQRSRRDRINSTTIPRKSKQYLKHQGAFGNFSVLFFGFSEKNPFYQ